MNDVQPDLVRELESLMAQGDESAVKQFVLDHLNEFSESIQQDFAMAMFEDALQDTVAKRGALVALKEKAAETIDAFESTEKN